MRQAFIPCAINLGICSSTHKDYKKSLYQTTAIHIQFISFSVSELLHLNTPHYDRH